jgi:hypothetical protein
VYIGAGMTVAIVARHWSEWSMAARRLVAAAVAACIIASPALIFVQSTAGLGNAWDQITTYARREGLRSKIFTPSTFSLSAPEPADDDRSSVPVAAERWLGRVASDENAAAWLYYVALGVPIVALLLAWRRAAGSPLNAAMVLSYSVLTELVALFVLRDPITARIGAVMPLVTIGGGYLVGEWIGALRTRWKASARSSWLTLGGLAAAGGLLCVMSIGSVCALVYFPPKSNLQFLRRWREYQHVPPDATLLPKGQLTPLVNYVHDCTRPTDRVLATWFVGELYFFSGRGFAAGLPVMFGDHWSELRYQRRSLELLEKQSVPLILMSDREEGLNPASYPFLWNFIRAHYERSSEIKLVDETVQLWVQRGRPVERRWGKTALPCFAPVS